MIFLQSPPQSALQNFIAQYLYINFNSSELPLSKQTFLPYEIPVIAFFIEPIFFDYSRKNLTGRRSALSKSVSSYYAGLVTSPFTLYFKENKNVKIFIVVFKPSGFSELFHKDMTEITDHAQDFSLLAGISETDLFIEQLRHVKDFSSQIKVANTFFQKRISHHHSNNANSAQIREACKKLIATNGLISIKKLAHQINMSLRTLERRFNKGVGVSPKIFARVKRFHHALSLMNSKKPLSWTDIANSCGYYDQAHFIKEFRIFTKQSPSSYSSRENFLFNQYILSRSYLLLLYFLIKNVDFLQYIF